MSLISMHSKKSSPRTSETGFTLIEVLISLFILVLIGVTTSKAVIDAAQLKEVLKDETEFSSEYRTSMGFIERDLNQIFNPRWFLSADLIPLDPYNPPPVTQTQTGATPPLTPEAINKFLKGYAFQSFEYWGAVLDNTGIRPSRFKGDEKSMSFITASHTRIYQQKKESIYAKVKYELIKQPPNPNLNDAQNAKLSGLYALMKTENTRAFELEEPKDANYSTEYLVLGNIKNFKISYYKAGEKSSVKNWDSDGAPVKAQDAKGKFPEAIEIELSLQALNGRTLDSKVLFKLETPNDVLPKTY